MKRLPSAIAAALIAAVLLAVVVGVARRYLFGAPLAWGDELAAVLFVWAVFWTAAFAVPLGEHVAFDLAFEALPPGARRALAIGVSFAVGLALLAALPKTVNFVAFLWRERTPALQWRLDYVYACFPMFLGAAGLRFLWQGVKLCRRRS
jgi:TRAP-type C4-dicarboxylate transport system permease small subunit